MSFDCAKCPASMLLVQSTRLVGQNCAPHAMYFGADESTISHEEENADIAF